jgi:sporulation protein YlmC with PRC-barrel domain
MIDIPVNANVECAGGPCGQSKCVIIDPVTQQVTHLVVKEKGLRHTKRLVPLAWIMETNHDLIHLRCTGAELAKITSFIGTELIQLERPLYLDAPYGWSSGLPKERITVSVDHERIPPGELAVHRGVKVEATDGHVGRVDEFLVDPETGHITHLVLREGHLWSRKDVTIPVTWIDHFEAHTAYLKLDRHTVELLPTFPVRWRNGR